MDPAPLAPGRLVTPRPARPHTGEHAARCGPNTFGIEMRGEHLALRRVHNGATLLVDPDAPPEPDAVVLAAARYGHEQDALYVGVWQRYDREVLFCDGHYPYHQGMLPVHHVRALGRVVLVQGPPMLVNAGLPGRFSEVVGDDSLANRDLHQGDRVTIRCQGTARSGRVVYANAWYGERDVAPVLAVYRRTKAGARLEYNAPPPWRRRALPVARFEIMGVVTGISHPVVHGEQYCMEKWMRPEGLLFPRQQEGWNDAAPVDQSA